MLDYKKRAKIFSKNWKDKGYEKGETSRFWIELLQEVYGIEKATDYIIFEKQVEVEKKTCFIDAIIPTTNVVIEQKSIDKNLLKAEKQSDGKFLTPFQQAKRYSNELPRSQKPQYIITSNFKEFHIYDMEKPHDEPEIILLENLEKEYHRLMFLIDDKNQNIQKEKEVSLKAGELVGKIYEKLLQEYNEPEDAETLKNLNVLCVRLVFLLYAEDTELLGKRNMFHDYLEKNRDDTNRFRDSLIKLFEILNQKTEERDPYLDKNLLEFPYINGGLFADKKIIVPRITKEIIEIILDRASLEFDWSDISPTIFGGVFESTLNPETRRTGGMHYTSIENIHKVIEPLFLEELREEFEEIKNETVLKKRNKKLMEFQDKISNLKFLDPACGSGNFLTETYLVLRKMENEIIEELHNQGQMIMGDIKNPIKVSIQQFYGIEVNDFAVTVAKTALWIAEAQMFEKTMSLVEMNLDFLPLKSFSNIVEANALRIDWNEIISNKEVNYIIGNPPFLGARLMSKTQKEDMNLVFGKLKGVGNLDYVSCWYKKSCEFIKDTEIACAFVSTNSITQGEQVGILWEDLFKNYKIYFNFAHRSFKWNSEATDKATVHCVIIGFSQIEKENKNIFISSEEKIKVKNISPYLTDNKEIFIKSRNKPICEIPKMAYGNVALDSGHLIFKENEKNNFIKIEPKSEKYFKKLLGARELLYNETRWCLWLVNIEPKNLMEMKEVLKLGEKVKNARLNAKDKGTQKLADRALEFRDIKNPDKYIAVPITTGENRKYIPITFADKNFIPAVTIQVIDNGNLYEFSILNSKLHMSWVRMVAGRLKSDYRYSKDIVYNNFPFPKCNEKQKEKIEKTAQEILNARNLYPESSLADLYNELTMPKELRKAHQENDKAVMEAYGFDYKMSESECVAELFKLYESLVGEKK